MSIHETAVLENAEVTDAEIREYVTIHDSTVGPGSRIYERVSIKKSDLAGPVDVNAGSYVENAEIAGYVQLGPNVTLAGMTHDLDADGMEFRNDRLETVTVEPGAFVGANAVVLPGVTIGSDAVVGAGATVTEDLPAATVHVGDGERHPVSE